MELFFFGIFIGMILILIMILIIGLTEDNGKIDTDNSLYIFFFNKKKNNIIIPKETIEESINVLNVIKRLLTRHERETIEEIIEYLENIIDEE